MCCNFVYILAHFWMHNIKNIRFKGYKVFPRTQYAEIENISRVNVIIGKNNCGKTSLLHSYFSPLYWVAKDLAYKDGSIKTFRRLRKIILIPLKSHSRIFPTVRKLISYSAGNMRGHPDIGVFLRKNGWNMRLIVVDIEPKFKQGRFRISIIFTILRMGK